MLKQTLTEYLAEFKTLKMQQDAFLRQAESRYQQDKKILDTVQREMIMSNKALTDSIEREIAKLSGSLLESTTKAVMIGLAQNATAFDRAIANIEAKEAAMLKRIDARHKAIEQRAQEMFDFDRVKQWVFWGGCVCNVIVMILLLFWLW